MINERRFKLVVLGTTGVGKTCLTLRFVKGLFDEEQLPTIGAAYMTKKISLPLPENSSTNRKKASSRSPKQPQSHSPRQLQSQSETKSQDFIVEIWDTAGQERYEAITPLYYRSAEAAIIAFDLTNKHSFEKAKDWLKRLRKERPDPNMPIALAGNKHDLRIKIDHELADKGPKASSPNSKVDQGDGSKNNNDEVNSTENEGGRNEVSVSLAKMTGLDLDLVNEEEVKQFVKENNLKYFTTSAKNGENIEEMFKWLAGSLPSHKDENKKGGVGVVFPGANDPEQNKTGCC